MAGSSGALELRGPSSRPSSLSTERWERPIREGFPKEEAYRGEGPEGEGPSAEHTPPCPAPRLPGPLGVHPSATPTNHNRNCPARPRATRTSRCQAGPPPGPTQDPAPPSSPVRPSPDPPGTGPQEVCGGRGQGLNTGPAPWEKPGLATLKPWLGGWARSSGTTRAISALGTNLSG